MKNSKLPLLIIFLGMISFVSAQTPSFSVKGGLNMSNLTGNDFDGFKMKPGFHIGVGADFDFTPNMSIQTALLYTTKGAKVTYEDEGGMYEQANAPTTRVGSIDDLTVNANYLQLPIHFAYKIDVAPGTKVALHAGPYVAYGIGGKIKGQGEETKTFDKDDGLKPFDAGVGVGVGAEFGRILVDLGWDMGLIDISQNNEGDGKLKTQNAYVSVGYKF